ncbi:DNA cytosine methyltransferase [Sinomonas gamaensis]|uniref:DNA cytosine methyltransferase n=1 Tax=Sinomonas gamaensis TaxID=2565624 RepID=UPI00110976F8|nr:DNA cytosine methyltransferase [Sinomonas gamaensis]
MSKTLGHRAPYERTPASDSIRVLDLFAGAGGLTQGLYAASPRFVTEQAVEIDLAAAASFAATFGRKKIFAGSIEQWLELGAVPKADVVVGGPPCQGFSLLGKRDPRDLRNQLWQAYAETIVQAKPTYFVVENVPAFSKSEQLADFKAATGRYGMLSDYAFDWHVLNAADYGAPQARKRAILIGHHRSVPSPGFPAPTHVGRHVSVRRALAAVSKDPTGTVLADRMTEFNGTRLRGPYTTAELHVDREYREISLQRFQAIPPGGNRFDLPEDLLAPCWVSHKSGSGDVMGRLRWDSPSVTIRTEFFKPEKGRYLHPEEHRAITPLEAALLQGFPLDRLWLGSKTSIARQIGNAVPIELGAAIGRLLAKNLA